MPILKSFSPQRMALLLNGKMTVDVWKTIPKSLKNGEPITVYGYCTINGGLLQRNLYEDKIIYLKGAREIPLNVALSPMNGLVACKFTAEKVDKVYYAPECFYTRDEDGFEREFDYKTAGMNYPKMRDYLGNYDNGKDGYALRITALEIIEPLKLGEFKHEVDVWVPEYQAFTDELRPLTKAPATWCYVIPPSADRATPEGGKKE